METIVDVDELKLIAGSLILDLTNTESGPPRGDPDVESLLSFGDLARWARRAGVLTDADAEAMRKAEARDPVAASEAFERALALRRDAFEVFAALAEGRRPPPPAVARLHATAAEALTRATLSDEDTRFSVRWDATDDPNRTWWPVAYDGLELLLHGPLDRIKGCGGCRYLFVDATKNRSRRWCSMDDCGTDAKMRTFVARRAARRNAATSLPSP